MIHCCENCTAVIAAEMGHIECLDGMLDRHELNDVDECELLEACILHGNFECFRWITEKLQVSKHALGAGLYSYASEQANVAWFQQLHSLGYDCGEDEEVLTLSVVGGSFDCVKFAFETLKCPVASEALEEAARFQRIDMLEYLIANMTDDVLRKDVFGYVLNQADDSEASLRCLSMLADAGFKPDIVDTIKLVEGSMEKLKAVYRVGNKETSEHVWPFCFYAATRHKYESLEYCLSLCPAGLLQELDEVVAQFATYDDDVWPRLKLADYPSIRKLFLQYNKREPNAEPIKTLVEEWRTYEAGVSSLLTDTCHVTPDVVKYDIMSFL